LFRTSIAQQQAGEILDTHAVTPGFGTGVAVGRCENDPRVNDGASPGSQQRTNPLDERIPENGER
jgi:hypothetical protein